MVKNMKLIYWSILGGVGFVTFFFFLNHEKEQITFDFQNQNFVISLILTISCILLSVLIFNRFISQIPQNIPLKEKLAKLQTAYLIRYALLEAPVFIIVFALQDNKSFFVLPAVIILYMLTLKPSKDKLITELGLNPEEIQRLNRENEEL